MSDYSYVCGIDLAKNHFSIHVVDAKGKVVLHKSVTRSKLLTTIAKISRTPETSEFTSVKKRVVAAKHQKQPKPLYPFIGNPRGNMPDGLPFHLSDYFELVNMTSRIIREEKRGAIDTTLLPILQRLNISSENWLCIATEFGERTGAVVGAEHSIAHYCNSNKLNRKPRFSYNQRLA